jgi:hypothetical protein
LNGRRRIEHSRLASMIRDDPSPAHRQIKTLYRPGGRTAEIAPSTTEPGHRV